MVEGKERKADLTGVQKKRGDGSANIPGNGCPSGLVDTETRVPLFRTADNGGEVKMTGAGSLGRRFRLRGPEAERRPNPEPVSDSAPECGTDPRHRLDEELCNGKGWDGESVGRSSAFHFGCAKPRDGVVGEVAEGDAGGETSSRKVCLFVGVGADVDAGDGIAEGDEDGDAPPDWAGCALWAVRGTEGAEGKVR